VTREEERRREERGEINREREREKEGEGWSSFVLDVRFVSISVTGLCPTQLATLWLIFCEAANPTTLSISQISCESTLRVKHPVHLTKIWCNIHVYLDVFYHTNTATSPQVSMIKLTREHKIPGRCVCKSTIMFY
jgi:hypothetical protein